MFIKVIEAKLNNNEVRAYKINTYDIFTTSQCYIHDPALFSIINLVKNRICYTVDVAGKLILDVAGDFRLIKAENGNGVFIYVKDSNDIEAENKIIEEYLSDKLIKTI